MALYEVERTDYVKPGEFVNALVIAGGTMQARKLVAHLNAGDVKNLRAKRVDTTKTTGVLSAYWDERNPEPAPGPFAHDDLAPATDYDSLLVE